MIKLNDGKIGAKEFFAMIIFMIGIKFKDGTPELLYEAGKNAAWMMPLFSLVFLLVPFLMLLSLLKKHQTGFLELIFKLTGNHVGSILILLLFVLFFGSVTVNYRIHAEIISTLFFTKTPVAILVFVIVAASLYIAYLGLETIGRISWLILPTFFALMIVLIAFTWRQINWGFFFPIEGPGLAAVLRESVKHSAIISEVILLSALYPFLQKERDFRSSFSIGIVFSCIQLAVFLVLLVLVFDFPGVANINFPYQQLTRFVTIGPIISHAEGLFLGFWSIVTAIHFAIYLILLVFLFARLLRLKENARLLIPLAGIIFFLSLFPENVFQLTEYRKAYIAFKSWFAFCLVILLWVLDKWKGWKRQ